MGIMKSKDIRTEINKSLDRLPDRVLHDLLELLHRVERKQTDGRTIDARLMDILSDDKVLLQRLD